MLACFKSPGEPSARSETCSPPTDGSDSRDKPKLYRLQLSVTEVGTEKFDDSSIQVCGRWVVSGQGRESGLTVSAYGLRAPGYGVSSGPPAVPGPWPVRFSPGHGAALIGCFRIKERIRARVPRVPHSVGGAGRWQVSRLLGAAIGLDWTKPRVSVSEDVQPSLPGAELGRPRALCALIAQLWSRGAEDPCHFPSPSFPQQSDPAIHPDGSIIIS